MVVCGASSTATITSRSDGSPCEIAEIWMRRKSPRALSRRRLSVSCSRPSGAPVLNCSSRSITAALVLMLPVMKMCSMIVCGPSTTLNTTSARAPSGVGTGTTGGTVTSADA